MQYNGQRLVHILGLNEGQDLEQLLHDDKTAGEYDDSLGRVDEPDLAHEKVMEFEIQFSADFGIVMLLKGP